MKEYISTIIYICVFSVILELILPENKLKKYVKVLASLIIILTLLTPIINLIQNDDVVATISNAINNIQSKVEVKEYNFNNLGNRLILSSVRESLEEEICSKCKEKFNTKYGINKVDISLDKDYKIEDIDVYVRSLPEIANAADIIDFVAEEYSIDASVINVIREE